MNSTPAVYYTPAFSVESSPSISTPAVFKHELCPWALRTPEDSPVCINLAPAMVLPHVQADQFISSELRAACAPFFEQMLHVLHHSQKMQTHPGSKLAEITAAMVHRASTSFPCSSTQLETMLDEASTDADDLDAFACLLSSPSSEGEGLDAECKSSGSDDVCPPPSLSHEVDESSDVEKSSMVCRHWKSKGWCRLGESCKFLHPEHKRGVTAPKSSCKNGTSCCSDVAQLDIDLTGARRRRRGGRNRSNKNKQDQFGYPEQELSGAQQNCYYDEYPVLSFPAMLIA